MDSSLPSITLRPGREKPVRNRHPWIFSGAVARSTGEPDPGDVVEVFSDSGEWLARAYFNDHSQITARILTWDQNERIDERFWSSRLEQSFKRREQLELEPETSAYRLVNAEADGLPGLIIDKYNDYLVWQLLTYGIERQRDLLVQLLAMRLAPKGIYERSDSPARKKEKLPRFAGSVWGEPPEKELIITENSLSFIVDLEKGHKTGFYLDQRDNRKAIIGMSLVNNQSILNAFAYTGGFAVYAAHGGAAKIVNIDDSGPALDLARRNQELNGHYRGEDEYLNGDAFQIMRRLYEDGRRFDTVILDPPKFAQNKGQVERACRGYKDINLLAMKLLAPGGNLVTFSCSGLVSRELFQKVLFGASLDANRHVQILAPLSQPPDHPISLTFPESEYLKGFICRVL